MSREQLLTAFFEGMASMHRSLAICGHGMSVHEVPTRAQFMLMGVLGRDGGQSVKELAEHFKMSSSAVTQLVDQLVDERLVTRKEGNEDRRKTTVSLTQKGRKLLEESRKARLARVREMLAGLTDAELRQLTGLQEKIIHSLQRSA
jgi:DNA-binding MarR family transcriptional regulator